MRDVLDSSVALKREHTKNTGTIQPGQYTPAGACRSRIAIVTLAPQKFTDWMTANKQISRTTGHEYRYHSRSDSHSKSLGRLIAKDLVASCPLLRAHARAGKVVCGINLKYSWTGSGKSKTIDLAIGTPPAGPLELQVADGELIEGVIGRVLFSCELKTVMTEHGKSQPRIYDELSSSHGIVHAGDNDAIAAGVTVVNIADRFASPLRQTKGQPLKFTHHTQPHAAQQMVMHLRGLPIRDDRTSVGFEAYATIVISCDNVNTATLHTEAPAPQPGERDHYDTFVQRFVKAYTERFSGL
jgi:hypothetical protein